MTFLIVASSPYKNSVILFFNVWFNNEILKHINKKYCFGYAVRIIKIPKLGNKINGLIWNWKIYKKSRVLPINL